MKRKEVTAVEASPACSHLLILRHFADDEVAREDINLLRSNGLQMASAVHLAMLPGRGNRDSGEKIDEEITVATKPSVLITGASTGIGAVYGATKAFMLFLSQSLHAEFGSKGVYIQAVLPAATRNEIWAHAGKDVDKLPAVMEVGELVDAALAGFDRRGTVTIPPLPDEGQWTTFEAARKVKLPNFSQAHAAERYRNAP